MLYLIRPIRKLQSFSVLVDLRQGPVLRRPLPGHHRSQRHQSQLQAGRRPVCFWLL